MVKPLLAILALVLCATSVFAFQYTASGAGYTIKDNDTECTGTTCVVYPVICNDLATQRTATVAVDFETIEASKIVVEGRDLRAEAVASPVLELVDEKEVTEPVAETRYAIEASDSFDPLECKTFETTIHPVFGGAYKYSVFADGFELDPLVNATRYEIGYQTASTWAVDRDETQSNVRLVDGDFFIELGVVN